MENSQQNCLFLNLSRLLSGDDDLCPIKAGQYLSMLTASEDLDPLLSEYEHIIYDLGILAELCLVNIEDEITERLFSNPYFKPQLDRIIQMWQRGGSSQVPVLTH